MVSSKTGWLVTCLVLVFIQLLLILLVFAPSLHNHFVSDDWTKLYSVSKAPDMREFVTFTTEWFVRPMQWMVTWALYNIFGLHPLPYHLTSVLLHCINTALFAILGFKLLSVSNTARRTNILLALLASALFMLNYRHHEAVFWYSSINELLAASFRFVALLLMLYVIGVNPRWRRRAIFYVFSVLAYLAALMSKESAVVLPAEILLLLCFLYFTRQPQVKGPLVRLAAAVLPFLAVAAIWLRSYIVTSSYYSTAAVGRAGLETLNATPLEWLLRLVQYLNGNFIGTGFVSKRTDLMVLELVCLCAAIVAALLRRRYLWIFALTWTLTAVAPYVATTSVDAVQHNLPVLALGVGGDRYLYYSSAGAALLAIASAQWILEAIGSQIDAKWPQVLVGLGFAVLLTLNAARLYKYGSDWETAGNISSRLLSQIVSFVPTPSPDSTICIERLPDNYAGKYVFRNGIRQALYLTYGRDTFAVKATVQPSFDSGGSARLDNTGCTNTLVFDNEFRALSYR